MASSSSSESLPSEIIFEILSRLPVESLLRCKSVCKSWLSLISDPRFIKYHLNLSTTDNPYAHRHLLVCCYGFNTSNISCPLYDVVYHHNTINLLELDNPLQPLVLLERALICGSCNGLICLRASYSMDYQDSNDLITHLFIWNPTTRNSIRFPEHPRTDHTVYLVYGFGYDESSDDYKLVEITSHDRHDYKVMMYSSKYGNWKEIGGFHRWISLKGPGVFQNGALHWIANQTSCEDSWIIVSLDLAKETYGEFLLQVDDEDSIFRKANHEVAMDFKLGILGDCLCVLCDYSRDSSLCCADVWVMKVYGVKDSWFKLVSIPYDSVNEFTRHDVDHLCLAPLHVSDDGKVLLQYESSLIVFDSKDETAFEIEYCDRCTSACIFVESLVSPSGTPSGRDLLANACAGVSSLKI